MLRRSEVDEHAISDLARLSRDFAESVSTWTRFRLLRSFYTTDMSGLKLTFVKRTRPRCCTALAKD